MCNDYRLKVDIERLREDFASLNIRIRFPEGIPNLEPRDDIRITDTAPIVRAVADEEGAADLVQRRWSWPGQGNRPVYCMRSEGRDFRSGRCLIPVDGFYEFTTPKDGAKKRKDKWLFTKRGEDWFCLAGLWRDTPGLGEAFTILTLDPGPDVRPYHNREVAVLAGDQLRAWIDPAIPARDILRPQPAGSLIVTQVG